MVPARSNRDPDQCERWASEEAFGFGTLRADRALRTLRTSGLSVDLRASPQPLQASRWSMMTGVLSDPLRENDVEVSRAQAPAQKLAQALDMMEAGLRLKRAALAHSHQQASAQQLDELMKRWLCSDG